MHISFSYIYIYFYAYPYLMASPITTNILSTRKKKQVINHRIEQYVIAFMPLLKPEIALNFAQINFPICRPLLKHTWKKILIWQK